MAIAEHASAVEGEAARFLVGSSKLDSFFLEVWGGGNLLERRSLSGGPQVVSVRVGPQHKGGFSVRWFGARELRLRHGQAAVNVPWADKQLSLKLDATEAVKPGRFTPERDHRFSPIGAQGN